MTDPTEAQVDALGPMADIAIDTDRDGPDDGEGVASRGGAPGDQYPSLPIRCKFRDTVPGVVRKSEPFSMRLSLVTDELITREAKRTRRSKGAVVESLAEEALRTRRLPGTAFRGTDWSRRAWVIGTALDVWEIVAASRGFDSPEHMVAETHLTEAQIRLALAYHREFPVEIDNAIAENERPIEQLRREYPAIDTLAFE